MENKVYLIGAGPGAPGLITIRADTILRQADVIIYDYLVDKRILEAAKPDAELICCDMLGGKRYPDGFLKCNERTNKLLIKKVKSGKKVVHLKNGDVSIFGRLSQELEAFVKENIEFEIVPGVTAASAAGAFSGIPLTDRRFSSSCVFVTGHEDPSKKQSALDWNILSQSGTMVLYMAIENLEKITKELISSGNSSDTPAAIIQNASLLTQRLLLGTLKDIAKKAKKQKLIPPAIVIIGKVVELEKNFNWLKKTKRILFTGISSERFFEKGFIFHLPLIRIVPLENYHRFDSALKEISKYNWLVFTSRYGVEYFFKHLNSIGFDARKFSQAKVAAIGNSTGNRLLDFGIIADLVPEEESSTGLIKAFRNFDIKNKKIFMPRSDLSDKGLTKALEEQGALVDSFEAYKNVIPEYLPDLDFRYFDEIIFTSPSGVKNFIQRYKKLPSKVKITCIGNITAKELRK